MNFICKVKIKVKKNKITNINNDADLLDLHFLFFNIHLNLTSKEY